MFPVQVNEIVLTISDLGLGPRLFNTTIDGFYCKNYGSCNDENPKFDAFKFVCTLKTHSKEEWIQNFCNSITNVEPDGNYCFLPKPYTRDTSPPDIGEYKSARTNKSRHGDVRDLTEFFVPINDILHNGIFAKFVGKRPGQNVAYSYSMPKKMETH
jgi:hypothetical protein